ncbi:unnamed protein product, partial [Amoebophrya sp. A25]|eukprot:GSA25T00023601001.1
MALPRPCSSPAGRISQAESGRGATLSSSSSVVPEKHSQIFLQSFLVLPRPPISSHLYADIDDEQEDGDGVGGNSTRTRGEVDDNGDKSRRSSPAKDAAKRNHPTSPSPKKGRGTSSLSDTHALITGGSPAFSRVKRHAHNLERKAGEALAAVEEKIGRIEQDGATSASSSLQLSTVLAAFEDLSAALQSRKKHTNLFALGSFEKALDRFIRDSIFFAAYLCETGEAAASASLLLQALDRLADLNNIKSESTDPEVNNSAARPSSRTHRDITIGCEAPVAHHDLQSQQEGEQDGPRLQEQKQMAEADQTITTTNISEAAVEVDQNQLVLEAHQAESKAKTSAAQFSLLQAVLYANLGIHYRRGRKSFAAVKHFEKALLALRASQSCAEKHAHSHEDLVHADLLGRVEMGLASLFPTKQARQSIELNLQAYMQLRARITHEEQTEESGASTPALADKVLKVGTIVGTRMSRSPSPRKSWKSRQTQRGDGSSATPRSNPQNGRKVKNLLARMNTTASASMSPSLSPGSKAKNAVVRSPTSITMRVDNEDGKTKQSFVTTIRAFGNSPSSSKRQEIPYKQMVRRLCICIYNMAVANCDIHEYRAAHTNVCEGMQLSRLYGLQDMQSRLNAILKIVTRPIEEVEPLRTTVPGSRKSGKTRFRSTTKTNYKKNMENIINYSHTPTCTEEKKHTLEGRGSDGAMQVSKPQAQRPHSALTRKPVTSPSSTIDESARGHSARFRGRRILIANAASRDKFHTRDSYHSDLEHRPSSVNLTGSSKKSRRHEHNSGGVLAEDENEFWSDNTMSRLHPGRASHSMYGENSPVARMRSTRISAAGARPPSLLPNERITSEDQQLSWLPSFWMKDPRDPFPALERNRDSHSSSDAVDLASAFLFDPGGLPSISEEPSSSSRAATAAKSRALQSCSHETVADKCRRSRAIEAVADRVRKLRKRKVPIPRRTVEDASATRIQARVRGAMVRRWGRNELVRALELSAAIEPRLLLRSVGAPVKDEKSMGSGLEIEEAGCNEKEVAASVCPTTQEGQNRRRPDLLEIDDTSEIVEGARSRSRSQVSAPTEISRDNKRKIALRVVLTARRARIEVAAALRIQACYRCLRARRFYARTLRDIAEDHALVLQRHVRGHLARMALRGQHNAACAIQCTMRRKWAKRATAARRAALGRLQRC